MRIIPSERFFTAKLAPHESFFVGLLYSMTHIKSMDSHRARCMNSRTVVREISQEIQLGLATNEELGCLCKEAESILKEDPLCGKFFLGHMKAVSVFLAAPPIRPKEEGKDKTQADNDNRFRQFRFAIDDFSVALENSYFNSLDQYLVTAIKPGNEGEIKILTSNLLSDLLDRGWPLESLFGWHRFFLRSDGHSFSENLRFMIKVLESARQEYEVILKITKSSKLHLIETHGEFAFSSDSGTTNQGGESFKNFVKPSLSVCFAKTKVSNFDFRSAAINARESFEQLTDLLRFGFEPDTLVLDQNTLVKRLGDNKTELILVRTGTPNPAQDMDREDFISLNKDLEIISRKSTVEESSKRRLHAAIRQYRLGRDTDNYKDKFLCWWMGLESLAHYGKGPIGSTVTRHVSDCMGIIYLHELLKDFLATLNYKFSKVGWPERLSPFTGGQNVTILSMVQLLEIIHSAEHRVYLLDSLQDDPILSYHWNDLVNRLLDPNKTSEFLQKHYDHLEWQLNRLYRIRCCIVHGSEIRFQLRLFAANLEYYLRRMIIMSLRTFTENNHIPSLEEFLLRASVTYSRILELAKEPAVSEGRTRDIVFADVVLGSR